MTNHTSLSPSCKEHQLEISLCTIIKGDKKGKIKEAVNIIIGNVNWDNELFQRNLFELRLYVAMPG